MPTLKSINYLKSNIQNICNMYQDGYSSNEISEILQISSSSIKKILKLNKIIIRDSGKSHKIYNCDDSIFKTLDSNEKAYWIGFLQADATINKGRLVLALSSKDKLHLEKFKSFIKSNSPIHEYKQIMGKKSIVKNKEKEYFYVYLGVSSKEMIQDLSKYDIVPNKTFKTNFGINIPDEFMGSYMAGLLDGDGFVTICNNKITLGFLGNSNTAIDYQKYLLNKLPNLSNNKIILHANMKNKSIRFSGKQVLDIGKFLYSNTKDYLPRKRDKILNFFQKNIF